jgi:hypothetical protein
MEASWPVVDGRIDGWWGADTPAEGDVAWIAKALVLNQAAKISGAHAPPGIFVLDKAFVLIEGYPAGIT